MTRKTLPRLDSRRFTRTDRTRANRPRLAEVELVLDSSDTVIRFEDGTYAVIPGSR